MRGARTNVQVYGCGAVFSALPMTYVSGLFFSCKSVLPVVLLIQNWFPEIREDGSKKLENVSDILNNIPIGVCVLFMPDDTHQEVRFANKQQMRLINPHASAPEKVDPGYERALRAGLIIKLHFNGVSILTKPSNGGCVSPRREFHQNQSGSARIRLRMTTD